MNDFLACLMFLLGLLVLLDGLCCYCCIAVRDETNLSRFMLVAAVALGAMAIATAIGVRPC